MCDVLFLFTRNITESSKRRLGLFCFKFKSSFFQSFSKNVTDESIHTKLSINTVTSCLEWHPKFGNTGEAEFRMAMPDLLGRDLPSKVWRLS